MNYKWHDSINNNKLTFYEKYNTQTHKEINFRLHAQTSTEFNNHMWNITLYLTDLDFAHTTQVKAPAKKAHV